MNQTERIINMIATQRNQALDTVAVTSAQRDIAIEERNIAFTLLDQCIKSGQIAQEDTSKFIEAVPGFAEWQLTKI